MKPKQDIMIIEDGILCTREGAAFGKEHEHWQGQAGIYRIWKGVVKHKSNRMPSEEWWHERSPLSSYILSSCNHSNDSLLNEKYAWEIRAFCIETSKHGQVRAKGEGDKCWDEPQMQPCSPEIMVGLSLQKQRDSLGGIPAGVSSKSCSWAKTQGEQRMGVQPWLSGGWESRQSNKATEPCCPTVSQSSPPFSHGVKLQSTSANLRTGTTESLFPPWVKAALCNQS